jgi:hypothetical protein
VGRRFRALFLAFLAGVDAVQGRLDEAQAKLDEADAGFAGAEDMLAAAAHVQRALVVLCLAARDDARGAHAQARARREEARGWIDGAVTPAPGATLPPAALLYEVRAALRVLERAHGAAALDARAQRFAHLCRARACATSLRLHAGGAWFELREGPRVSCERRQVLRRLLVALGEHRVRAPGEALSAAALIAAGWPGERILHAAARNRLKFSVALLRRLGLRDAIRSQGSGYLIDPALALEWAE